MTTETFFQLHYHLTDTEGLFDLAQGIAVQRRRLKKHDARCRSFRWFSRRLLWQGAVLLALGAVLLWLTASLALGRASGALTGLYLCRRICGNLGHTIRASSVPNQGTEIRIGLGQKKTLPE